MKWATKSAYKPAKCIITKTKRQKSTKIQRFFNFKQLCFHEQVSYVTFCFDIKSHISYTQKNKFDVFKHTTQTLLSRHQFLLPSNHFVVGIWLVIILYEGNYLTTQDPFISIFKFRILYLSFDFCVPYHFDIHTLILFIALFL